jgi:hypothetical protein
VRPARHRHAPVAAAAIALAAAAVVWLTWPLAAHLTTHLPNTHPACNFDTLHMAWALAHESRALLGPASVADANAFFPTRGALFYGDGGFGSLPFFLPVFRATANPTLAVNVAFLLPIALTAASLLLVVRCWTGSALGGVVAAWTFLVTRWTLWDFVPTAPQYATLFYLPAIVLLAAAPAAGAGRTLLLAALVALQSLSSVLYVAAAVVGPLGVLALWRLLRPGTRAAGLRLLAALGLALVAVAPVAAGYLRLRVADPGLAERTYWSWWQPVSALPWHPVLGYQVPTAVPPSAFGLCLLGLALFAARRAPGAERAAWRHAGFWALAGMLISLNPAATFAGAPITLPHTLLAEWVPLYRTLREPARLGVGGLVGLALLAGLAFAECARRLPARGARATRAVLAAALLAVLYADARRGMPAFGHEPRPPRYPLVQAVSGDTAVVRALREPGGPLLEVPVGLTPYGCIPGYHARAMYRAIHHGRPLLNGYSGYWPAGFLERMALAERLPDPAALAALRRDPGLGAILVSTRDLPPPLAARWEAAAAARDGALRLVVRDGGDLLFSVGGP